MTHNELTTRVQKIASLISYAKAQGKDIAYLSGKVTGLVPKECAQKFRRDADMLRKRNYWVFNPAEWINDDCDWQMAMRLCLAVLPMCEKLFRQPDWIDSKGAIWECETAEKLGIEIFDL